jgi:hypothetical protein
VLLAERAQVLRIALEHRALGSRGLDVLPSSFLTYAGSNAAGIGWIARSASAMGSRWRCDVEHPGLGADTYASSGNGSQAPNTMSSRSASGTKSDQRRRSSVRLPSRTPVPIWVSEPIGSAMTPADQLDAGDEGGRHGAEPDAHDAESAACLPV